ncbi:hypothetical protein H0X09_00770 [Candidatus Saccharibacteria bacterium]|nr:hypothetical protein [Candidatus Saccharibacteria bacterium]
MKTSINIKSLSTKLNRYTRLASTHATFIVIIVILLTYLLVVWRISSLATAEPSAESETSTTNNIPRVNKKAVEQILKLEENNSEVRSLFNEARNNPFQE